MSTVYDGAVQSGELANELAICRQRGIERLDRESHNQSPVRLPQLELLARDYIAVSGQAIRGRIPQIKALLQGALAAYRRQGNLEDAKLISDLFFGDATNIVLRSAGELLEIARARHGKLPADQFRERRRIAFQHFADFIISFVSGDEYQQSEQDRIEETLATAATITICGVAPRSLVDGMRRVAKEASVLGHPVEWRRITYITPASTLIFATQGHTRMGSAAQKWQFALKGIRDCIRQVQQDAEHMTQSPLEVKLSLLGVMELFLEVVLITRHSETGNQRLWVSLGPNIGREEPLYLCFDEDTDHFERIKTMVDQMGGASTPIVSRTLEVCPDGLETIRMLGLPDESRKLEVRAIQPIRAPTSLPSCLPVAITVLRTAEAGRPVVLLQQRSRFTNWDDFDKMSLLSTRLLEEDLAGALGVPVYPDLDGPVALDAMWKAYGKPERLPIPLEAFIRAAQRDVFRSCGLDIATSRFVHRGCQLVEREEEGSFLFFCIFEVILRRNRNEDELQLAREWSPDQLEPVYEDMLYSSGIKEHLNRLLAVRQEWFEGAIFQRPISYME